MAFASTKASPTPLHRLGLCAGGPRNLSRRGRDVRSSSVFGPNSLQGVVFDDIDPRPCGVSEDCLYLNVWTPSKPRRSERLPVMVWIYGGGFVVGSGSEPRYDGTRLAARGVVVVTLNHRLNALGFLAHPELTAQSERRASGNYGMLDLVAALQWVRGNIAAFGGDPDQVTIAGEFRGLRGRQRTDRFAALQATVRPRNWRERGDIRHAEPRAGAARESRG